MNDISIKIQSGDRALIHTLQEMIQRLQGFQIQRPEDKQAPDILIYELHGNLKEEFRRIESMLESGSVGDIFLTSKEVNAEVILHSLRTGAKEFFPQPLREAEVMRSLENFRKRRKQNPAQLTSARGKIVHVIGSKGGVGATTVTVNLAAALSAGKKEYSVSIVDMKVIFGDIPIFLGVSPVHHWGELCESIDRLDGAFLRGFLTRHPCGIYLLASPYVLNGKSHPTPDSFFQLLKAMQSEFDLVIVDGGQSLNELSLESVQAADDILLVSLLNLPCLKNASKILRNINGQAMERTKIVISQYRKGSPLTLKDAEKAIGKKPFWTIPNDEKNTAAAINEGKPLIQVAARCAATKSIRKLAYALLEDGEQTKRRWGLFRKRPQ